jgi:hypothetical protein
MRFVPKPSKKKMEFGNYTDLLTIDSEARKERSCPIAYGIPLMFLFMLPIFLLCWMHLLNVLRRYGYITRRQADHVMEEMQSIRVNDPKFFH